MIELRISGRPKDSDIHTWADYLEMLALVNLDGSCDFEFALDRVLDSPEVDNNEDDEEDGEHGAGDQAATERLRAREKNRSQITDAYLLCAWRSVAYGAAYPFKLADDRRSLHLCKPLEEGQLSYLFLLLCGNQPFILRQKHILTSGFEVFCKRVFHSLLPAGSEVYLFGAATSSRYAGTKIQKLTQLCNDVRGKMLQDETSYREGDTGDGGVDIVGWHGLHDDASNIVVSFAQCACSRSDWSRKQAEVGAGIFNAFITAPPWMPVIFIPVCFRSSEGGWAYSAAVKDTVVMDRLRILRNCPDLAKANADCDVQNIVHSVTAIESVV